MGTVLPETPYCQFDEHRDKQIPAVIRAEAHTVGCSADHMLAFSCAEHMPTVSETLAHNKRQGTTLIRLSVHMLDGRPVEFYSYEGE